MQTLKYKTTKYLLGSLKVTRPDGWKDLGTVKPKILGGGFSRDTEHGFCHTIAHVGKADSGELFYFCPMCKVVMVPVPDPVREGKEVMGREGGTNEE